MFSKFFIEHPIFATVISIVIVIAGVVSFGALPVAQYPEITPPTVEVKATYPGANAQVVTETVAASIEQEVNGVENMIYMSSTSASDGSYTLTVTFEIGTNLDIAQVMVQNRVKLAESKLPEEVRRQGINTKKKSPNILQLISLFSPDGRYDVLFLSNYATLRLRDSLSRIRGVGDVTIFPPSDYSMRIWLDPHQLKSRSLTTQDVLSAVREQNVQVAAGQIGQPPAPRGQNFQYTVNVLGRLTDIEQFEEIIIKTGKGGRITRLKDIARIELGGKSYDITSGMNGAPSASVLIYQLPGANALDVAQQIRATMAELSTFFPEGMEYKIPFDTTIFVEESIKEVYVTLFQAAGLVFLVLFLFLQDWRATIIPGVAIPVSLIGTLAVMLMMGFSLNMLTLFGLVLAIGIVVDDAIVVVEAVSQKMERGMAAKQATIEAMREVAAPIVATSLSLIAVFVPVAAMGGITGQLYQQFAITIAISVALSSVNALTLSPALAALLLKPPGEQTSTFDRFFQAFNRVFEQATGKFMIYTGFFTRRLIRAGVLIGALLVGLFWLFSAVPGGFVPEEDQGYVLAALQLPDAASLQRTEQVMSQVEEIFAEFDAVESFTTVSGFSMLTNTTQSNAGFVFVQLKDWEERPDVRDHAQNIVRRLNAAFATRITEAIAFAFGPPAIPGLGTGSGFTMMLQDLGGNPPQYLAEQTQKFIAAASQRPEIASAGSLYRASVPQIYMDIDKPKALKLGVPLSDVNTSIGAFLGGAYVNDFNRFGRLYKVYVQAEPEYRDSEDGIRMFYVRNNQGNMVPLSTLVTTSRSQGAEFTNRFNLFRSAEVSGQPAAGYSSAQALAALEAVAKETLPSDMSYAWSNMSYQEKRAEGTGAIVFVMALVFVFLILAAQYESWSLPLSVMLGTPIAVFGAMGGLWIARLFSESYVNNVFAQIGLVMLIGMTAKNAILIVEFASQEMNAGKTPLQAALDAARSRFRPILMTAFSFILGVVPLLIASGAGAEARKVMGMTVFSGMLAATVIGVLVVPAMFVFVEKFISRRKKTVAVNAGAEP